MSGVFSSILENSKDISEVSSFAPSTAPAIDRNTSPMEKLDINVAPVTGNTGALKRDVSMGTGDLGQAQQASSGMKARANDAMGTARAQWDQKKGVLGAAVEQEKTAQGVNGSTPGPAGAAGKLTAAAAIATTVVAGPAVGMAMNFGTIAQSIIGEAKKMKRGDLESFMADVKERMNPSEAQKDVLTSSQFGAVDSGPDDVTDCTLAGMTPDELIEFMEASFEDQPEIEELFAHLEDLAEVDTNHALNEEAAYNPTAENFELAVERGDTRTAEVISDASPRITNAEVGAFELAPAQLAQVVPGCGIDISEALAKLAEKPADFVPAHKIADPKLQAPDQASAMF